MSDSNRSEEIVGTKIAKRFFKEKPKEFSEENYIMDKLGYQIFWIKEIISEYEN